MDEGQVDAKVFMAWAVYNKRIGGMKLYPAGEYEFLADVSIRN